jgi:hypothetical protein
MQHRVDIVLTDVSEERIASIFRLEEKRKFASEEPARAGSHTDEYTYEGVLVCHAMQSCKAAPVYIRNLLPASSG